MPRAPQSQRRRLLVPEGDTLRHAAARLRPVLEHQTVVAIWFRKLRGYRPRVGDTITSVEAVGKYLLIQFGERLVLHTHLGMAGSWSAAPLERPVPSTPKLRIVIETAAGRALCFAAPTIATYLIDDPASPTANLGPDLSNDHPDLEEVLARSRRAAHKSSYLASVLLDQSVAAGVGNVFKSEALFVAGLHPFTPVSAVDDKDLLALWRTAHRQLRANRNRSMRRTTGPGARSRMHVYRRHRSGCLLCDNAIDYSPAGLLTPRSTYWCPTCQPVQPGSPPT